MRKLGVVAIVLVALLLATQFALYAVYPISLLTMGSDGPGLLPSLLALLPMLFIGWISLYLLFGRHTVAARLFEDEPLDLAVDTYGLMRVALVVIGLIFAVRGITSGVEGAVDTLVQSRMPDFQFAPLQAVGSIVSALVQLTIGSILVVRSEVIAARLLGASALGTAGLGETENLECPHCGTPYSESDYRDGAEWRCTECGRPLKSDDA